MFVPSNSMRKLFLQRFLSILVIASFFTSFFSLGHSALAATVTSFSDNMSRLQTSTLANHTIKFITPTGVAAGQNITITFDPDFTMGSFSVNNIDVATAATCGGSFSDKTLAASALAATWGVAQSGQVITITSGTDTIAATSCISVEIGSNATSGASGTIQITNPAVAQTATLVIGGSFGDSGTAGLAIVNADQVSVTATVDPTISFAITDTTIGYATLSSSAARWATGDTLGSASATSAHDITVATNAPAGYTVYVLGDTLTSGLNTITAIGGSATASSPGSEQFGLKVAAAGGTGAAVAPYASANYAYAANSTTQDDIAASTTASATTTFSITYIANISSTTEAGSYATTLTYSAIGNF